MIMATVALPLQMPLQVTAADVPEVDNIPAAVIVTVGVCVQPAASVMVHVYVPAHSEDAVDEAPPEGAHENV